MDPAFETFGAWWVIPNATLVVRAGGATTRGNYFDGQVDRDVWSMDIIDVILGEYAGGSIQVASVRDQPLPSGEAIYFLVPLRLSWDTWSPDIWVPSGGELGVLTEDVDRWQRALPSGSDALAMMWGANHIDLDSVGQAIHTRYNRMLWMTGSG